jgi:hypothetical protein
MPTTETAIFKASQEGSKWDEYQVLARLVAAERSRKSGAPMSYVEKKSARMMSRVVAQIMNGATTRHGETYWPEDGKKVRDSRRSQKLSRLIARLFPEVKDHLRQAACNHAQSTCWHVGRMVIARGDEAERIYGELGSHRTVRACMTGDCSEYTRIYANNPDNVGVAYYQIGNEILARRLVWTDNNGDHFLDRQYPNSCTDATDRLEAALLAELDGDVYLRTDHCQGRGCFKHSQTGELAEPTQITLDPPDNGYMPYLDSFSHSYDHPRDSDEITLTNWYTSDSIVFHSTGGGWEDNRTICRDCNELSDNDTTLCDYCTECRAEREREEAEARRAEHAALIGNLEAPEDISRTDHGMLLYHPTRPTHIKRFAIVTNRLHDFFLYDGYCARIAPHSGHAPCNWFVVPADWQEITAAELVGLPLGWIRITATDNSEPSYYRNRSENLYAERLWPADNTQTYRYINDMIDTADSIHKIEYLQLPTVERLQEINQTANNADEGSE